MSADLKTADRKQTTWMAQKSDSCPLTLTSSTFNSISPHENNRSRSTPP